MVDYVAARRSEFVINELYVDDVRILAESILNPWGGDDNVVEAFVAGTYHEQTTLKFWSLLAQAASGAEIMLDVGAYTGLFSILAARSSPIKRIVAFEPSAITYGRLAQNISLNEVRTRIVPCNLAASSSEALMTMPHQWGHYTLCSGESLDAAEHDHTQPAYGVPLDCLLDQSRAMHYLTSRSCSPWPFERVAAIKIDVEGAELTVLAGARELIARDQPVIIAEALSAQSEAGLAAFAQSVGYEIARIGSEWNFALYSHSDARAASILERALTYPAELRAVRRLRYEL